MPAAPGNRQGICTRGCVRSQTKVLPCSLQGGSSAFYVLTIPRPREASEAGLFCALTQAPLHHSISLPVLKVLFLPPFRPPISCPCSVSGASSLGGVTCQAEELVGGRCQGPREVPLHTASSSPAETPESFTQDRFLFHFFREWPEVI